MFNLESFLNLLNVISIIGFLISGIVGLIAVANEFYLSRMLISINSILLFNILLYIEFLNYRKSIKKIYLIRGVIFVFYGILLLDVKTIGCAFGIFSIVVGTFNIIYNFFNGNDKFSNLNIDSSISRNYNNINEKFINDN
jgi:hypothetical protein